jgi:hypothetical protein
MRGHGSLASTSPCCSKTDLPDATFPFRRFSTGSQIEDVPYDFRATFSFGAARLTLANCGPIVATRKIVVKSL